MKWNQFTIETTTEAVDILSYELDAIGVEGIQIEDNVPLSPEDQQLLFGEILPELPPDDGCATIHFYMDPDQCNPERVLSQVQQILSEVSTYSNIGKGTVSMATTDDIDWLHNWKKFFKTFRAANHIVVKPTWETDTLSTPNDIVLQIDPGVAFGTGSHETTMLCIQALDRYVTKGMHVLDVGCGSGILSIASLKLGAEHVTAIDIDPVTLAVTKENLQVNQIPASSYEVFIGDIISDPVIKDRVGYKKYNLVVANILPIILIPLASQIRPHLEKDGLFIVSGILDSKQLQVQEALESNGFHIIETLPMNEWISIICN